MDKQAKVPKLRFPGFTGEWEERKLGDICEEFRSGKFIKAADVYEVGKYPVYGGNGMRGYTDSYNHDGIYTIIGRQGAWCGNVRKSIGKAYFTEHAIAAKANVENDTGFLYQLLGELNLGQYSDQSAQPGLAVNKLIQLKVIVPNKEEQRMIGEFLGRYDSVIRFHQRKLTHLQKEKKSLLQKMFPKKGERFPELRFPGFTGDWEERKLGEVTESYSGGTPSVGKCEYYNGNIPFIRSAEINSFSTELFISEKGIANSSAKMVDVGDILYALYGATSGETGISRISGAINQAILAIKPFANYDSYFIMQWLRGRKQAIIDKYLQGGQGNLSGSIVKNLEMNFPSFEEQHVIGIFFQRIDNCINLHQRKLSHLKKQKQALLQQMFV